MKNCGFTYQRKGVIINMAPADIRKEGSAYDLTIAIGVTPVNFDELNEKKEQTGEQSTQIRESSQSQRGSKFTF